MKKSLMIVRIGEGEDQQAELQEKRDEFLDIYSLYLKTGLRWVKEEAMQKAYELHLLDPTFSCEI